MEKGANVNNADEWGEFLHLPGQKFHDFGKIREEIVRDTEKMTGKNAGELDCHMALRFERIFSYKYLLSHLRHLPQPYQLADLLAQRSHADFGRFTWFDQSACRRST